MPIAKQLDAVIALLAGRFPNTFAVFQERRKPLKLSIHRDVAAAVGAIQHLKPALACYTSNIAYLWALKAGAPRFDLDGNPAGVVDAEQAAHARQRAIWQR